MTLDDPSKPSPTAPAVARMYDWYLGGTHNYAIDVAAGEDVLRAIPDIKQLAIENRSFLRRAVRYLVKQGFTQFLDIGSGLPTVGSTHETAIKVNKNCRVLYVDMEESAVEEGRSVIEEGGWGGQVGMIRADALKPQTIFDNDETTRVIDFSKPVVLIMLSLMHFFTIPQCTAVTRFWQENLVKGSAFVFSHVTAEGKSQEQYDETVAVYARAKTLLVWRLRDEIKPIVEGWNLVEPGLAMAHDWRLEELEESEREAERTGSWCVGVGILP